MVWVAQRAITPTCPPTEPGTPTTVIETFLPFVLVLGGGYVLLQGALLLFFGSTLRQPSQRSTTDLPTAVVIIPCRDAGPGFADRIRVLLEQDHPDYRVVFVTESTSDPAWPELFRLVTECPSKALLVTAGPTHGRSQKVHNLLRGLREVGGAKVFAFADSDVFYSKSWLGRLVTPLLEDRIAATTGCFWLEAKGPGPWGQALAWTVNQASLLIFAVPGIPILWGGSMAIRKDTAGALVLEELWGDSAYDDLTLTAALWRRRWRAAFVPDLLLSTPVREETFGAVQDWYLRQMTASKVYMPLFHWLNLLRVPWSAALLVGPWLVLLGILLPTWKLASLLGGLCLLFLWVRMASGALLGFLLGRPDLVQSAGSHYCAVLLDFLVALRSLGGRRIRWASREYLLFSHRTEVLKPRKPRGAPPRLSNQQSEALNHE